MNPLAELAPDQPPSPRPPGVVAWYAEGFRDRLGDRLLLFDTTGPGLEMLRLASELVAANGFEAALRARVDELKRFRHEGFARVRAVKWLDDPQPQLALVSEHVAGERLSRVLDAARTRGLAPGPDAVVWLLARLLPGLAALHDYRDLSHGLLGPDRIIVTPGGDLVITDYALGGAVEGLRLTPFEVWQRYGIDARKELGRTAFDRQADVEQVARLAIGVLSGRPHDPHGRPESAAELLEQVRGPLEGPSGPALRAWLVRALGLEGSPFPTARHAHEALQTLLPRSVETRPGWLLPEGAAAGEDSTGLSAGRIARGNAGGHVARRALPQAAATSIERWAEVPPPEPPAERQVRRLRYLSAGLAGLAVAEAVLLFMAIRAHQAEPDHPAVARTALAAPHEAPPAPPPVGLTGQSSGRSTASQREQPATSGTSGQILSGAPPGAALPGAVRPPQASRGVIGWLRVTSDVNVRVYANGRLLGSGPGGTFRLPEGSHDITLVNESAGVHDAQTVTIVPGETVRIVRPSSE